MKLSRFFHLKEFTWSDTAARWNIRNEPSPEQVERMRWLAMWVLDPTREKFGRIYISSGLRIPELNARVGGARDSGHKYEDGKGAVDIQPKEAPMDVVFEWIRTQMQQHGWPLHKLILERGRQKRHENDDCIHIEVAPEPGRIVMLGPTHGQGEYQILSRGLERV